MQRPFAQMADLSMMQSFHDHTSKGLKRWPGSGEVEVVVGVPFHDEDDTLPAVVRTARQGLKAAGLAARSAVLVVGSQAGARALERARAVAAEDREIPVHGFILGAGLEGRGWCARALMVAAEAVKAPLVLLNPDLVPQPDGGDRPGRGFSPGWVGRLLSAVRERGRDLALARFTRHPLAHPVESLLASPVLIGAFGVRIRQPMPGVCALSPRMVRKCLTTTDSWSQETGTYGVDLWLTCRALAEECAVGEVPLGLASFRHDVGRLKTIFRQVTHVLFQQIETEERWAVQADGATRGVSLHGAEPDMSPPAFNLDPGHLLRRFKLEFDHFDHTLFRRVVPESLRRRLEEAVDRGPSTVSISDSEWVRVIRDFLRAYGLDRTYHPNDVVDGLFPFFVAHLVGLAAETKRLEQALEGASKLMPRERRNLVVGQLERRTGTLSDRVIEIWPDLHRAWQERERKHGAYLPRLCTWELVPHVGVTVPQEVERAEGEPARAADVYKELVDRYRRQFLKFLAGELGIEHVSDSNRILDGVTGFMRKLEGVLNETVFPGDLSSLEGARALAKELHGRFSGGTSFQLTEEAALELVQRVPPRNLVTHLSATDLGGLLARVNPRDALAMAAWTDHHPYLDRVLDVVEKDAEPDWFEVAPVGVVSMDPNRLGSVDEIHGTGALRRLAGRMAVGSTLKGWGGDFPKTWFVLNVLKRLAGLELYSEIWQTLVREGPDVGQRIVGSIRGHWGRIPLSAHNLFENHQQRIVARRLGEFASDLAVNDPSGMTAADVLKAASAVYHLSITLPDSTFVPLSAWTWASYSHRGGVGAPTPLSSLVERDWASADFLTEYVKQAGLGDEKAVERNVLDLVGEGRAFEDVGELMLGATVDWDDFTVPQTPTDSAVLAGRLVRPVRGPILEPIQSHLWESRYVLNAAAVRLEGTIYILYRAFGQDETSRIGLAWTADGVHVDGRLDRPVFEPVHPAESAGCEDPRVAVIGDRMYMLYTAWDRKVPQIAMASIDVQAFLERRFDAWERHGLAFPGLSNKDAVLYPEKFDGQFVVYHRIDPSMWISYIEQLECPWPRTGQKTFLGPRPGMMWDGVKIGAGAPPIKTAYGWLNIYHGVDYDRWYRLGVFFTDPEDPAKVLYQSPNPILEPEADFEIGRSAAGDFWVPHVVFTCGAVPAEDKDVIDLDDEILVYYGAADTAIGVARGKLRDLVPVLDKPLQKTGSDEGVSMASGR
jgi:predicted GH43/DUF377 family glycosyl hydrolase